VHLRVRFRFCFRFVQETKSAETSALPSASQLRRTLYSVTTESLKAVWSFLVTERSSFETGATLLRCMLLNRFATIDRRERRTNANHTIQERQGCRTQTCDLTAKATEGKMVAEDLVENRKKKAQRLVRKGF